MENLAVLPALGLVRVKKLSARRLRHKSKSFAEEIQKHFQVLNIPVGASKSRIKDAYRALVSQNHPDHGGDSETLKVVVEAYRALRNALPQRGRPRKYARCDGFAIVDELQDNAVVAQGFESRREAKDALKRLRSLSVTEGPSTAGKPCRLAVVGSVSSQKNEKYRRRKRANDAEKLTFKYWNNLLAKSGLGLRSGLFAEDAPHGCGLLVTGGYSSSKIESVTAAHDQSLGGPVIPARRVQGDGNGPDAFDKPDETADELDVCEYLSRDDYDRSIEREFQGTDEFFLAGDNDKLLGPSKEDRCLPPATGWDDLDFDTSEPVEKCDEISDMPGVDAVNLLKE